MGRSLTWQGHAPHAPGLVPAHLRHCRPCTKRTPEERDRMLSVLVDELRKKSPQDVAQLSRALCAASIPCTPNRASGFLSAHKDIFEPAGGWHLRSIS